MASEILNFVRCFCWEILCSAMAYKVDWDLHIQIISIRIGFLIFSRKETEFQRCALKFLMEGRIYKQYYKYMKARSLTCEFHYADKNQLLSRVVFNQKKKKKVVGPNSP